MDRNEKSRPYTSKLTKSVLPFLCGAAVFIPIFTTLTAASTPTLGAKPVAFVETREDMDYYHIMRECAADGSESALELGRVCEEERNQKIEATGMPYRRTSFFQDHSTGEAILAAMNAAYQLQEQEKVARLRAEHAAAGEVYAYLNERGFSDTVIAGILGNMMAECGGQTLDLQWGIYGGNYYGLCQWSLCYNPSVNGLDVAGQLDYLMSNLRTNMEAFGGSYDNFCAIKDAGYAARYFCGYYERGAGKAVRARNAYVALAWIQGI